MIGVTFFGLLLTPVFFTTLRRKTQTPPVQAPVHELPAPTPAE
jgi:hypothetical protein